jgi:glycosyltransferase involved in cell wall biosynthesis
LNDGVLYLIQSAEVSGAERMHAPLIREDPDALVACPPESGAAEFARGIGADVIPFAFRPLRHSGGLIESFRSVARGLRGARDLRRILKAHPDRDTVFCVSLRAGMLAALASIGLRRKLLWCAADLMPPAPLRWIVRMMIRRTAHRVLCLSHAIANDLVGGSEHLRRLSSVVHPGVELEAFDPSVADPRAPVAAVLGHVSPLKRTDLAVDIADAVAADTPDFRLRVIGRAQFRDEDFELERKLREQVEASDRLSAAVRFEGFAEDVGAALSGCGMLLHCRPDEPFGIALIEAMAMGMPVVAPAAGGPLEIVQDGVTGVLYEPDDAIAGAAAVKRLIDDPDGAERMGAAARRRVEEHFEIGRQIAETRALLPR